MVETSRYDKPKYKALGMFATISAHGGLLLFFLLFAMTTPNPPYPEGGGGPGMGIEVNLGMSEVGTGDMQEDITFPELNESQVSSTAAEQQDDNKDLISSDSKDAEGIKEVKKDIKKNDALKNNNTDQKKDPNATNVANNNVRVVDSRTLYKKNTNQGEGNGVGDQGNKNGNPLSNQYNGDGSGGNGTGPGAGGGTGGGFGLGNGTGIGPGSGFSLNGRKSIFLSTPEKIKNQFGIVVVEITVDREGKVVNAVPGYKGSTALDADLLRVAKEAALKSHFDRKPDSPEFQKGTITYNFVSQ